MQKYLNVKILDLEDPVKSFNVQESTIYSVEADPIRDEADEIVEFWHQENPDLDVTAKTLAIRDVALKRLEGVVPTRRQAQKLSDDELIERLTTIRGVGRWTVEMLLMFNLGRPDILPVDDFGVREGWRVLKKLQAQPKPKELKVIGEAWSPHRSAAAWYLWRASELGRTAVVSTMTGG